ncbi:MAG: AAA family ATPase, partial [Rhodospirillaceae bacterium]
GEVVEWLVDMNRFDDSGLFDRLIQSGGLRRHPMVDLADHIAEFHAEAEIREDAGGAAGTWGIVDNISACFDGTEATLDADKVAVWRAVSRAAFDAVAGDLDARRAAGAVRHCHGDMHLRNICMIDGRPVLFDGIEFNPDFSEIDTLYDLAFLLMDLDYRGERRLASIVFNRYLDVTGEVAGRPGTLAVLPLFLSMRAAVRAHVDAAQAATLGDPHEAAERAGEAVRYLDLAIAYLDPTPPRLVAVGGLSGGGKSRMARELAPYLSNAPGARVVRTDAVRKRLAGAGQEERLGPDSYTAEMHEKTYAALYDEVRIALAQGSAAVADAVFPNPVQRTRIAAVADAAGVPFNGLWIEAPEEVRVARVKARQRNISDVTESVAREQSTYDLGEIDWNWIDSSGDKDATVARGRRALGVG